MTFSNPDSSGIPDPDHRQHPGSDEGLSSPKQGVGPHHDSEIRNPDVAFPVRRNPNLPGKSAIPSGAASSSGRGQNRSRQNRSLARPNPDVWRCIPNNPIERIEFKNEHDQVGLEVLRIHSKQEKAGILKKEIEFCFVLATSNCSRATLISNIKSVSSIAQQSPNCRVRVIDSKKISQTHQRLVVLVSRKKSMPVEFLYRDTFGSVGRKRKIAERAAKVLGAREFCRDWRPTGHLHDYCILRRF